MKIQSSNFDVATKTVFLPQCEEGDVVTFSGYLPGGLVAGWEYRLRYSNDDIRKLDTRNFQLVRFEDAAVDFTSCGLGEIDVTPAAPV